MANVSRPQLISLREGLGGEFLRAGGERLSRRLYSLPTFRGSSEGGWAENQESQVRVRPGHGETV